MRSLLLVSALLASSAAFARPKSCQDILDAQKIPVCWEIATNTSTQDMAKGQYWTTPWDYEKSIDFQGDDAQACLDTFAMPASKAGQCIP